MKKKSILGLIFGAGIGLCAGILTGNISIGLALGAGVGLVFGTMIEKKETIFKYASLTFVLMVLWLVVIFLPHLR